MDENVQRAPETNVQRLQVSKRQHEKDVERKPKKNYQYKQMQCTICPDMQIDFSFDVHSCSESQLQRHHTKQMQSIGGRTPGEGR